MPSPFRCQTEGPNEPTQQASVHVHHHLLCFARAWPACLCFARCSLPPSAVGSSRLRALLHRCKRKKGAQGSRRRRDHPKCGALALALKATVKNEAFAFAIPSTPSFSPGHLHVSMPVSQSRSLPRAQYSVLHLQWCASVSPYTKCSEVIKTQDAARPCTLCTCHYSGKYAVVAA